MAVDLYIFRHGETDWNRYSRWQGQKNDIPLNDLGREQARALIPILKPLRLDMILASDLSRAKETAEIIGNEINVALDFHIGLRELYFGEAEGLTVDEIVKKFGPEARTQGRSMLDADLDFRFPGAESKRELISRSLAAIESYIFERPSHARIGVATHGGIIRGLLQHAGEKHVEPTSIPNASLFHMNFDRQTKHLTYLAKLG